MAVDKLVPTANATDTGGVLLTNNFSLIDETVASADGSVNSTNVDDISALAAAVWNSISDLSSSPSSINSATFRVRARVTRSSGTDDTYTYRLRCVVGGTNYDITYTDADVDAGFIDRTIAVSTAHTEAQFNGATFELQQTLYSKTKGFDNCQLDIDAIELEVDYVAGALEGDLAATEAQDTASLAGGVIVAGDLAATDAADVAALAGDVLVQADLAGIEGSDIAAFSGQVSDVAQGDLAAIDNPDTAALDGAVVVAGALVGTDAQDVAMFAGDVMVAGDLSASEGADAAALAGGVLVQGDVAATDAIDVGAFSGTTIAPAVGDLAATEAADTAAFTDLKGGARTLSAVVNTNINKQVTHPTWLLKLHYSTPLRATSRGQVTIGADNFGRQGLRVENMTEAVLQFVLRDDDDAVKALVDFEGIDDIAVTLWAYYETDGVVVWTGFLDGVRYRNHEARFSAARVAAGAATFPSRFFHRGDFPYMPVEGTEIKWAGHVLTLRVR